MRRPTRPRATGRAAALFIAVVSSALAGSAGSAQDVEVIDLGPTPRPMHEYGEARRIESEVHAAILSKDRPDVRDAHIDRAVAISRGLVETSPESAEAHYWLAVSLGLETEYSGALAKLTTGKECYEATARALELDPDHPGAHELLGRIHAGVMRLPWLVRKLGGSLGMNDALGQASWESAEQHLVRATRLDGDAIAPRLELGKLMTELDRPAEAATWFERALEIEPVTELDHAMVAEADSLLRAVPN